ncbi:MAG: Panacea domain-containing protein [Pauljensenia sp.]
MARSVVDVATYILERTDTITTMKLQKLAFYAQVQHLVTTGAPLFPEDFQAWRGGPVVPELYALHRGKFLIRPGELSSGDSSALTDAERGLIDRVCSALGGMTGAELSERTHLESPWLHAREGLAPSAPSDAVITQEAMRSYYQGHPVLD